MCSGALATTSVVSFLRHPSLRSTFYLLAGSLAAGTYYLDAQAVNTRLEDGPWGGVGEPPFLISTRLIAFRPTDQRRLYPKLRRP